jgi:WD40 repeat protein
MRDSLSKPARTFKLPYMISALAFQNHEDLYQCLAVGLVDGAIIILDLVLGVERSFLEKHPGEITTLAFWEEKVLISGSIDGRVVV